MFPLLSIFHDFLLLYPSVVAFYFSAFRLLGFLWREDVIFFVFPSLFWSSHCSVSSFATGLCITNFTVLSSHVSFFSFHSLQSHCHLESRFGRYVVFLDTFPFFVFLSNSSFNLRAICPYHETRSFRADELRLFVFCFSYVLVCLKPATGSSPNTPALECSRKEKSVKKRCVTNTVTSEPSGSVFQVRQTNPANLVVKVSGVSIDRIGSPFSCRPE